MIIDDMNVEWVAVLGCARPVKAWLEDQNGFFVRYLTDEEMDKVAANRKVLLDAEREAKLAGRGVPARTSTA